MPKVLEFIFPVCPRRGEGYPPACGCPATPRLSDLPSLSSVSGLKQTLLAESGAVTSYSHRVFSAWDFGLSGEVHVRLRQRNILFELQVRLGVGGPTTKCHPRGRG